MSTKRKPNKGDPRKQAKPPGWTALRLMDPEEVADDVAKTMPKEVSLSPDQLAAAKAQAASVETWRNSRYLVRVYRQDDQEDGAVRALQVQVKTEAQGQHWADLQRIKNEIAGPEAEAYEIYPAESRLLDGGGPVYWLFVMKPGEQVNGGICEKPGVLPIRRPIIDGYIPPGFRKMGRMVRADYE